jgi:hypothetical protein
MRTPTIRSLLFLACAGTPMVALAQAHVEISAAVHHDQLPSLRAVPPRPLDTSRGQHVIPLRLIPPAATASEVADDSVAQSRPQLSLAAPITLSKTFAGVGNGDYGFSPDAAPPDTNGAVGATQYVQWVNESFAVFNKATGALVLGPVAGNTLWAGFGGGCEANNDGDPIVKWDNASQRWFMTQFSVSTTPNMQCVAVSQTADATGAWNRYAFQYSQFPDYPKVGVWSNAYVITFNMFGTTTFAGARVCAYDKAKMVAGLPATQQCVQLSSSFGSLLPADPDGASPIAANAPNYLLNFSGSQLNLWKFTIDFNTPANTNLAGPSAIPVAAFTPACKGGACVPQPGTKGRLDSLGDRLMYRLAYRLFPDGHEALLVSHAVNAPGATRRKPHTGVRWYEVRNPNGAPVVFQQGTYVPDASSRWMSSAAFDKQGNIAIGYSLSSSSVFPSVVVSTRAVGEPAGTLSNETVLKAGAGSQTGGLNRWGDYSAMVVDPSDDCSFWYTNEYLKASGSFNWSTWIASFKINGCS